MAHVINKVNVPPVIYLVLLIDFVIHASLKEKFQKVKWNFKFLLSSKWNTLGNTMFNILLVNVEIYLFYNTMIIWVHFCCFRRFEQTRDDWYTNFLVGKTEKFPHGRIRVFPKYFLHIIVKDQGEWYLHSVKYCFTGGRYSVPNHLSISRNCKNTLDILGFYPFAPWYQNYYHSVIILLRRARPTLP